MKKAKPMVRKKSNLLETAAEIGKDNKISAEKQRIVTFERYAKMGCSMDEIRGIMWMDRDDLDTWIEKQYKMDTDEVLQRLKGAGIADLRESLLEFAKTNAHVAKWLGQLMFGSQQTAGDDITVRLWSELDPKEGLKKAKKAPKA